MRELVVVASPTNSQGRAFPLCPALTFTATKNPHTNQKKVGNFL